MYVWPESRRDQEVGGELDFHEELDNHLRVSPGEKIKRREVVLAPQESTGEDQEQEGGTGLRKLDNLLLQLFLSSCATDIVLVTRSAQQLKQQLAECYGHCHCDLLRTAVETAISGVLRTLSL